MDQSGSGIYENQYVLMNSIQQQQAPFKQPSLKTIEITKQNLKPVSKSKKKKKQKAQSVDWTSQLNKTEDAYMGKNI